MNRKKLLLFILLSAVSITGSIFACEMIYSLVSDSGDTRVLSPDRTVSLDYGEIYSLEVIFHQDHGVCDVPADDTIFMLEEEKWRASKDYLPFQLLNEIIWIEDGSRMFKTVINFKTTVEGPASLQIIRVCDRKSGYDESIEFEIR